MNGLTGLSGQRCTVAQVVMFDARFPPPVVGGKEKQVMMLKEALTKLSACVYVITFAFSGNKEGYDRKLGIVRLRTGLSAPLALLVSLIRFRIRARLLHIHTPSRIGILCACIGRVVGYRVIFKVPNEGLMSGPIGSIGWLRRKLVPRLCTVVCLDEGTQRLLVRSGVTQSRVRQMCNGVEIPVMSGDGHRVRQRSGDPRMLFIGRLVSQKRCEDAIRVLAKLHDRGVGGTLTVVGDGPEKERLQCFAQSMRLMDYVHFAGRQFDVGHFLADATLLMLPSAREGMPNVVLEAMSHGVPVIGTRVGAMETLLGPDFLRYSANVGDIEGLAEIVQRLTESNEELDQYGRRLRARCVANFSIASIARQYLALYESVAQ